MAMVTPTGTNPCMWNGRRNPTCAMASSVRLTMARKAIYGDGSTTHRYNVIMP